MNSTSNDNLSNINEFFFEELVPLAKKLHVKYDSVFFLKKPDNSVNTYFVNRIKATMDPGDFETGGCNSPEDLKKALIRLWLDEGYSELSLLAEGIVKLAESFHQAEDQSSEVSPFIYVMF
jgi:hypothetical protein